MTLPDLEAYVATLPADLQALYRTADRFVVEAADTSDDDFQIWASVLQIFADRCADRLAIDPDYFRQDSDGSSGSTAATS